MTTLRRFTCDDMFKYNNVNLDVLTETVSLAFLFFLTLPLKLAISQVYNDHQCTSSCRSVLTLFISTNNPLSPSLFATFVIAPP